MGILLALPLQVPQQLLVIELQDHDDASSDGPLTESSTLVLKSALRNNAEQGMNWHTTPID